MPTLMNPKHNNADDNFLSPSFFAGTYIYLAKTDANNMKDMNVTLYLDLFS